MPNHFHLVVETPRGTLVAGMKWFLQRGQSRLLGTPVPAQAVDQRMPASRVKGSTSSLNDWHHLVGDPQRMRVKHTQKATLCTYNMHTEAHTVGLKNKRAYSPNITCGEEAMAFSWTSN